MKKRNIYALPNSILDPYHISKELRSRSSEPCLLECFREVALPYLRRRRRRFLCVDLSWQLFHITKSTAHINVVSPASHPFRRRQRTHNASPTPWSFLRPSRLFPIYANRRLTNTSPMSLPNFRIGTLVAHPAEITSTSLVMCRRAS